MKNLVNHLGIIMDGNRRWARKNKMASILQGHEKGATKLIDACKWCTNHGISFLSVYAFSTENWSRTESEIAGLIKLMDYFFKTRLDEVISEGVRVKILGNMSQFHQDTKKLIADTELATSGCSKLTLNIALSYGGRDELVRAIQKCAFDVHNGLLLPTEITDSIFAKYLDTRGCPDIDMVIRTGGYHRLSNFFPWQTVYSEIYFTDVLWPDFSYKDFCDALSHYENIVINKGK